MNKIYIFGAGINGKALLRLFDKLEIENVVAFIDNSIEKQGMEIEGKRCISMSEAIDMGGQDELVIVSVAKYEEIEEQLKKANFKNIFSWSRIFLQAAYSIPNVLKSSDYRDVHPFNHYESPYPDIVKIHEKEKEIFDYSKEVLDIDFNISEQLQMVKRMEQLSLPQWSYNECGDKYRYSYHNDWFGKGSADALCYMIQILKPDNIIEVGSGHSTAVMLDTNENYFDNRINIVSIEPRADRLKSLLKPTDNLDIIESDVQDVSVDFFERLKENDILFIDSSHVSKISADVNYILFEIFPRLKKGVYIHFHDMFYPFIYPKEWIYEGRAYNEMYLIRAFLMNNKNYSIQLFGGMLEEKYLDKIVNQLWGVGSGSLWIKKEEASGTNG